MYNWTKLPLLLTLACALSWPQLHAASSPSPGGLSPIALVASPDGRNLFIACATGERVLQFDLSQGKAINSFEDLARWRNGGD